LFIGFAYNESTTGVLAHGNLKILTTGVPQTSTSPKIAH
jgi:hypothetical protein